MKIPIWLSFNEYLDFYVTHDIFVDEIKITKNLQQKFEEHWLKSSNLLYC